MNIIHWLLLLIGKTSTGQLTVNEEEKETRRDLNSKDRSEKTQKSDLALTKTDS